MKHPDNQRTFKSHPIHSPRRLSPVVITLMIALFSSATVSAKKFELTSNSKTSNSVTLTQRAMITYVKTSGKIRNYTIWRNGSAYLTINNLHYQKNDKSKHHIKGVLEPGRYMVRVNPGASVKIGLSTTVKPQRVLLWGKHHKIVKPLEQGNRIVITKPTKITDVHFNGTKGFTIQSLTFSTKVVGVVRPNVVLRYISPHNTTEKGPRVIGGTGGKTVVGQTLPPGIYRVAIEQGKVDGIVDCNITLTIN